ncbi:MAG: prepilin-type N-terminal cleavage/methylation domain-containing protein, partial [Gammaproteobacteria bacterium]
MCVPKNHTLNKKRQSGFSLIEISIVLLISGLLLSG